MQPSFSGGSSGPFRTLSSYTAGLFQRSPPNARREHQVGAPDSAQFLWKEFSGFFSAYDVRGQVFITYRYADPHRAPDGP